jgi:hypothetical protein
MILKRIFSRRKSAKDFITVVSGLPRSGTSMMMQVLEAGGLKPVTDNIRHADESNAKGYYEHEAVKALSKGNYDCLKNAQGSAIKVISSLLRHLPSDQHYKIIFMQRSIEDVLNSQEKMLLSLNKPSNSEDNKKLKQLYLQHLSNISNWLSRQKHIDVLYLDYAKVISEPNNHINQIVEFVKIRKKVKPMIACIDKRMSHSNYAEKTIV